MNRNQQRYNRMDTTLRLNFGRATHTIRGKYVMLDGEPVGELGWKWWVYKVIDALGWKSERKSKEEKEYERLRNVYLD